MLRVLIGAMLIAQQATTQCGGASTANSQNIVPLQLTAGPAGNASNVAFVSVTICVAGQAADCQSIDNVLVDTGSTGLRVLASVLTVALQPQATASGASVLECFPFQDGYTWGPVAVADIKIGAKQANAVPVQIIGGAGLPAAPADCVNSGLPSEDTVDVLAANGVLGLGVFRQDCGLDCSFTGLANPGLYFACSASGCQTTAEALTQQVQNPVWKFSTDNNGVVIEVPDVAIPGQPSALGMLTFGIGTQTNNALGRATVLTLAADGTFTATMSGTSNPGFIDSGSNGYYFLDAATSQIPTCSDTADFYCPPTTVNLSAANAGTNGKSSSVSFSVANADTLPDLAVLPQLAGPFPGYVDWGLPFFFGRTVFIAIEGQTTPAGSGPYFAY